MAADHNPNTCTKDLQTLPKAHLHLHFAGSMRHSTLLDLAEQHGVNLPQSLKSLELPPLDNSARGWFRFQHLYEASRAVIRSPADMQRVVLEAAQDDAAEGSRWLEIQIDPSGYAKIAGGLTAALEVVLAAAKTASQETSCQVAVIVAANRTKHPLEARTLARLAAQFAGDGAGHVVGFGLSNDERQGRTEAFAPAFKIARRAGLALVPHSGELLGPEHVRTTLTALQPDRIGHGVRSVEDPAVLHEVVAAGVALEVCPTSNVALGVYPTMAQVPLPTLIAAGVDVALGADDPLLFGHRLVAQYRLARQVHHLSDQMLADVARASFRAARMPQTERIVALQAVAQWLTD